MNTIEESQPGAVPTIEVSNRTRMDVKKDYVLGDPFKIRFRIEEFKPGEGNEDGSGSWTSPEVLRGGKKFSIVVSGGDQTFLQATVKTEDTFDGSIELVLVNQANATRNMRCRGPTGSFVLKPEVLKNNGNGWVQATCLIVEAECREFVKAEVLWNPKPVLSNNMRTLLHTGAGADMIFSVQGLSFSAHSCIVSLSSPVLGVVGSTDGDGGYSLSGDMEEIEIIGVQPGVFKELLCFIYVDEKTDEKVWRDSTLEVYVHVLHWHCVHETGTYQHMYTSLPHHLLPPLPHYPSYWRLRTVSTSIDSSFWPSSTCAVRALPWTEWQRCSCSPSRTAARSSRRHVWASGQRTQLPSWNPRRGTS